MHLQGKLPGWRNDQGEGRGRLLKSLGAHPEDYLQWPRHMQPFCRASLRRNQQIAVCGIVRQHGRLDRRRLIVIALRQRSGELRAGRQK